jgi:predicted permease
MAATPTPPRFPYALLAATLPDTVAGRSALGDLLEDYSRRPAGFRRRLWFWMTTFDLVVRYAPSRLAEALGGARRDVVYAVRLSRRHPAPAVAAVLSLGLAIGVGTAAFSLINGSLLRSYLAADPSVVTVWRRHAQGASRLWPARELLELRRTAALTLLEGSTSARLPVATTVNDGEREPAQITFVTGTYFSTFSISAAVGRLLTSDDDRLGTAVVVLDHLYWRRHFNGASDVIGRTIRIADAPFAVIGVAERDFVDPIGGQPAMWAALGSAPMVRATSLTADRLYMVGRLAERAMPQDAEAELSGLAAGLAGSKSAVEPRATSVDVTQVTGPGLLVRFRILLIGVASVIALVIVLACANVSNLQVAGAAARRQEIAIRLSCGGSRTRIVRQFLTESMLVSAVSGAIGFALAQWLAPVLAVTLGWASTDLEPDVRVYAFVVLVSTACAIGSALAPAWFGVRRSMSATLKDGGAHDGGAHRSGRARSALIGVQAAASVVLVVLAALLVRAALHLGWLDPGIDADRLLAVHASIGGGVNGESRASLFWSVASERVRALPGVDGVALAAFAPFGTRVPNDLLHNETDADYFETVGLTVVRGRGYTAAEVKGHEPVAVISQQVAREFWNTANPLGDTLSRIDRDKAAYRVIGVVEDALFDATHGRQLPMIYSPLRPGRARALLVRTSRPQAIIASIRQALGTVSPSPVTFSVLSSQHAMQLERPRRLAFLAAAVGVFALVLSVVGLAGVTAFAVRMRTREIGIRMALGARARTVIGLLIRDGMRPVVAGLTAGLVAALLAGQVIAGMLYGVSPRDPWAMAIAVLVLMVAALVAVFLPSRRAARIDPAAVLRDV